MLPIVAQFANSAGASFLVTDRPEQVLQPLVTFNLPESHARLCGNILTGEQCCGRTVRRCKPVARWPKALYLGHASEVDPMREVGAMGVQPISEHQGRPETGDEPVAFHLVCVGFGARESL
jgi:hypothetical protein